VSFITRFEKLLAWDRRTGYVALVTFSFEEQCEWQRRLRDLEQPGPYPDGRKSSSRRASLARSAALTATTPSAVGR
jgi:hypothetical protein